MLNILMKQGTSIFNSAIQSLFLCVVTLLYIESVRAEDVPLCLAKNVQLPDWLSISGSHRTRYESLNNRFRSGRRGGDQALLFRTLLLTKIKFENFEVGIELMDSRAKHVDKGTPISTGLVNPIDFLQVYASWTVNDLFLEESTSVIRMGRFTMDVGSRRFVARNRFRNTINAFTGLDWRWTSSKNQIFRAFYTLPVNRFPNQADDLLDSDINFDEERTEIRFWGLYFSTPTWFENDRGEIFFFGLNETDTSDRRTRDRDIYTTGFRVFREAVVGRFDYQLEAAFQFGNLRASALSTDTEDLDHFAQFVHAEIGYTFNAPWKPQLLFQYDYGSGDDNPNDGENERFDTLFGARRFDFGPTSIHGPFSRMNINTPGIRLKLSPTENIKTFIAYRGFWLDSNKDAWVTTGVRDVAGDSGDFIGHQIEMRVRWNVVPKNLRLEIGFAHLFDGEFMKSALNAPDQGDVTYLYSQASFYF